MDEEKNRPNPDALLESIQAEETKQSRTEGKLKIFFGYAAGVGKTYAMLDDARQQLSNGVDVVVGYLEPHLRAETMQLVEGLPMLPPQLIRYKNIELKEFDLDEALRRKPKLILVDELAHTNAAGVRNKKRYQDVEELLKAGIDVYTTVNVQHIESLNDIVQDLTKIQVQETVPDYIFDQAELVKLIDIEPDELLKRLEAGKIYRKDRAEKALNHFFTRENLRLLREVALRKAAARIGNENRSEVQMAETLASTRLMVCIGPSPSSAKCIRWTSRTADAFHAPWVAAFVETADASALTEDEKKSIRANLELAERLGAEIVTLNGTDISSVIAEYAKMSGITNIVIGKSRRRKTLRNHFELDLEDQLISALPHVEIHIIPSSPPQKQVRKAKRVNLGRNLSFSFADSTKTVCYLIAATLLCVGLKAAHLGDQNIIMVYILSVLIVSRTTMGYAYGVISSILSVLAFNFFFTVPYFTFNAIQPGYPVTFFIMLLVALITSAMTVRVKTQAQLAVEREHRTEVLYEINKKLLATREIESITALMNEYLTTLFRRSAIFYTQNPEIETGVFLQASTEKDASFLRSESEQAVAYWAYVNQKNAGAGTDTLMGAKGFYMPVMSQGKVLGVVGISCGTEKLNQSNRLFLQMIISQVAMALERQALSDRQKDILIEAEKEKMRSNLLRAISHDLRTPLTCISGAVSAILENGETLDEQTKEQFLLNIKQDSQWLIRMVENILSVTRINEGTSSVTKTPEAAEEIVAEAVSRIRSRFPEQTIVVKVPEELLMVPMDGTLIEQVLMNLMENAIKHAKADTEIEVKVKKHHSEAVFEVIDYGDGISDQDFPYLFESYMPNQKRSSDSSRGLGIGLSICMSIIKAHHGKMEAVNKKDGGAVFRFILPLEEGEEHGG
jgi:two-component system sensor histidine kinase KdpD